MALRVACRMGPAGVERGGNWDTSMHDGGLDLGKAGRGSVWLHFGGRVDSASDELLVERLRN